MSNVIHGKFAPLQIKRSARAVEAWLNEINVSDMFKFWFMNVVQAIVETAEDPNEDLGFGLGCVEPKSGETKLAFLYNGNDRELVNVTYFKNMPEAIGRMAFSGTAYVPREQNQMMNWLQEHRDWLIERLGLDLSEHDIPGPYFFIQLFQAVITGKVKGLFWDDTSVGSRWYLYIFEEEDVEAPEGVRVSAIFIDFGAEGLDASYT